MRISNAAKEFNVSHNTIIELLNKTGVEAELTPSTKLTEEQYQLLKKTFSSDKDLKEKADKILQGKEKEKKEKKKARQEIKTSSKEEVFRFGGETNTVQVKTVGHIELDENGLPKPKPVVEKPAELTAEEKKTNKVGAEVDGVFKLHNKVEVQGPKVMGKIDLSTINAATHPKRKTKEEKKKERLEKQNEKKKRQRIGTAPVDVNTVVKQGQGQNKSNQNNEAKANQPAKQNNNKKNKKNNAKSPIAKPELTEEEVAKQVKETLARLTQKGNNKTNKGAKYRKEKREQVREQ